MYKILFSIIVGMGGMAFANYDRTVKESKGTYTETFDYAVDADDSQLITSQAGVKLVDGTCRNNDSSFEIFIGTNAAGTSLRDMGFPIKALETFELGAFSGDVYAIAETGQTVEVRCWEGKIR